MKGSVFVAGILVILTCPPAAVAQECPFPDSVAVADTLDPAGYFPLQVGNTWDYILRDQAFIGGLWRQVVETDTLIAGVAYSKVKVTNFIYDADEISQSSTTYQYITATDTSIDHWGHGAVSMPRPFSADFSSCSSGFLVSGGYNVPFQISIGDSSMTVDSAVVKAFKGEFGEWTYARDVGLVQAIGDPSLETQLLYARTDRFEGGTPIENLFNVTVSRENEEVRSSELSLQSYPNPFHERLHIDVSAEIGLDHHLEMLDVLG